MKYLKLLFLIFLCSGLFQNVDAQIAVIVKKGNFLDDITIAELKEIFLGEKKTWGNGTRIILVDQKSNRDLSNNFYKVTTGKSLSRVKEIWIKKMITGEMSPPKAFNSDADIIYFVSQNYGAIGFIEAKNKVDIVKVLTIEGKSPDDSKYKLK